jgi:hypothetical protein
VTIHSTRQRAVLAEALQAVTPTIKDIADRLGISYGMARHFRVGAKRVSAELMRDLADLLDRHATDLRARAKALRRAARTSDRER